MSPNDTQKSGPCEWELKLCRKLGVDYSSIEETHQYLSKSIPLYQKVTQTVFPTINNSIDFIHSNILTDSNRKNQRAQDTEIDRSESDVAKIIEAEGCSVAVLYALVSALAPAGLALIRHLYRGIREGKLPKEDSGLPIDVIDYINAEDSFEGDQIDGHDTSKGNFTIRFGSPGDNKGQNFPCEDFQKNNVVDTVVESTVERNKQPVEDRIPSEFDHADERQALELTERLARIELPTVKERTPWVNSFIDKIDFMRTDKFKVVKFYENRNDAGYTERNLNIIKFYTALKLQKAFDLADDDIVYRKFEAWLVRDVLLQGHIFVTRDAICFYLLLPGKIQNPEDQDPDIALHEGALGHGDSYFSAVKKHRSWAVLRPHSLSFYSSPTEVYFPTKVIDLKSALYCQLIDDFNGNNSVPKSDIQRGSASNSGAATPVTNSETSSISEQQHEDSETVPKGAWFELICLNKVYKFQTQGLHSARHWVIALTKVIFTLKNTNGSNETILKIPIEEILDYHKKYVLVGDEDFQENSCKLERPITFSLSYNLPPSKINENLKSMRMKPAMNKRILNTSDSVNLLLFSSGEDLIQLVDSVCENHIKKRFGLSEDNLTLNREASQEFWKNRNSDHYETRSTLLPEFLSGTSIMNRIESVNHEILKYRTEQYYRYQDGKIIEPHSEEKQNSQKNRVLKVLSLSDRFFGHPSTDATSSDLLDNEINTPSNVSLSSAFDDLQDDTCESFEHVWDSDPIVNLPKPFSVQTLLSSGMLIQAQRRNINDVVLKYSVLLFSQQEEESSKVAKEKSSSALTENQPDIKNGPLKRTVSKIKLLKRSVKTVSTMGGLWSAEPEHFSVDEIGNRYYVEDVRERVKAVNRFRNYFSFGHETVLAASYFTHLKRSIPIYGRLYIANDKLCFRSLLPGITTKMILPFKNVQQCVKSTLRESHYFSEKITVKGMEEMLFEFGNANHRDDFHKTIQSCLFEKYNSNGEQQKEEENEKTYALVPKTKTEFNPDRYYHSRIRAARLRLLEDKVSFASGIDFPLIIEDNPIIFTEVTIAKPYNIVLLTIGSRGDVQPYIALGKELIMEGHNVTIATHSEFKDWIQKHGINYRELAGDPAELMQLMVTHGSLSVAFLKEAHAKFKDWILSLLETSWEACQGADLLIESPSAMAGIHIAEAMGIPYMRAFTMPWTRSRAYPHAFIVPDQKRGGSYNLLTHVMFENIFWKGISGQVNSWREHTLRLPRTNLAKLQQSRVPFLYNVSPAILPPSVDFPDWVKVTGYWFLNEGSSDYEPPAELVHFLEKAQRERKKIVYVGFGSIVVSDANALTQTIVDSILELDVMCILNRGWSDRLSKSDSSPKVPLPPEIYDCGSIPHDWLFPRIDVAVHHGGSGTTGASLRAGLPSIIKPFFGDQFFYASRIEDLGVGMGLKTLNQKTFSKAIKLVISEKKYKLKAQAIASTMLKERGVLSAVEAIYTELAYAKSLMLNIKNNTKGS